MLINHFSCFFAPESQNSSAPRYRLIMTTPLSTCAAGCARLVWPPPITMSFLRLCKLNYQLQSGGHRPQLICSKVISTTFRANLHEFAYMRKMKIFAIRNLTSLSPDLKYTQNSRVFSFMCHTSKCDKQFSIFYACSISIYDT